MSETSASTLPVRLYHAPSSYYSMIARLSLAEAGLAYAPVFMDLHARSSQQAPSYARLNPNMTVPTLVGPDFVLIESRAIAEFALGQREAELDAETRAWLALHYGFPIEELTFGNLLARSRLARVLIPRRLASAERRLEAMAAANPDLAKIYTARAAVFARRVATFEPDQAIALAARRQSEARSFLDRLETTLADGRDAIVPARYGLADVVWTVFLGRIEFAGMGAEIAVRPALRRYWRAMQARPSFAGADIWTRLHVGRLIAGILWPPEASATSTSPTLFRPLRSLLGPQREGIQR
ncbi:MAG: glutathione S-transferase family protein [Caulobacteraceae bacterium]